MANPGVTLFVLSADTRSERRFNRFSSISDIKSKLELITGIPVNNQDLYIYATESDETPISHLADETKQLGYYSPHEFQFLKVIDTNPSTSLTGQLTDVSQVEKFELSQEEYAQRRDSVLAYKKLHKVGRFAPKDVSPVASAYDVAPQIDIGSRCQVESTEADLKKRGTVRYVGETKFASGYWVGVEYDEPLGKNDGSVSGVRYFECRPNYGIFIRSDAIKVGDYPVEELNLDEEEI